MLVSYLIAKDIKYFRVFTSQQFFSVDLDSVYDGPKKPLYELAKVEMDARNKFQVSIQVQYVDGLGYQEFTSVPFLMKTRPRKRTRLGESVASVVLNGYTFMIQDN